ncbi:unnamed protein product, partial [Effrenium voratum]
VIGQIFSSLITIIEKLVMFLIDVVVNSLKLVRAIFFSIFRLIHKDLGGMRAWTEECPAVSPALPSSEEIAASSVMEADSESFCLHGTLQRCASLSTSAREELLGAQAVLDASNDFYKELAGVSEPEKKRKIIGRLFVEAFEKAVSEMGLPHEKCLLLQGTLYPDVIESTSYKGPSSVIKTHHNVGGLPDRMKMEVIEPLRLLFKDEVRKLGNELGLPVTSVMRHPFPGPGLGIRIIGEVTKESAVTLSAADDIYIEELRKAGHYDKIGQAFAVLLPTVRSVGVMGDHRTYENVCVLRAVTTTDFMTADWYDMPHDLLARISNRIINEVKGINRVCYDVSSKPPATIEWE